MTERVEVELLVRAMTQGFDKLTNNIAGVGSTTTTAAASLDKLGTSAKGLDSGIDQVSQSMRTADQSARKMGDGLQEAGKNTRVLDESSRRVTETLGSMVQTLGRIQAGALVVAGVFQKAFDLAQEGAAIERTEMRLGRLAETIGTTADALQGKMGEATRGLVSDAELAASAGQIISLGLADTEEGVVRLATVISSLGLDMNQVILTFANNSIMRLDALGLSVDDVRERAERLEATGLDANKAFDTAVLEALEAKMKLLGGDTDDSAAAFKRFSVEVINLTDQFKMFMAEGLGPYVSALSGTNARAFTALTDGQREAAKSLADYIATGKRLSEVGNIWLGLGVVVTGNEKAHHSALVNLATDIANASGSYAEFEAAFNAAFDANARYNIKGLESAEVFYAQAKAAQHFAYTLSQNYQPATSMATGSTVGLAVAAESAGIAMRDGTGAIVGYVGQMQLLGTGVHMTMLSHRELAGTMYEVKAAADATPLAGIRDAWTEVFGETDKAKYVFEEYKKLLTSSETAEQKAAIIDLAEYWGLVTAAEAAAQRETLALQETTSRVMENMEMLVGGTVQVFYNLEGAARAARDMINQIEYGPPGALFTPPGPPPMGGGSSGGGDETGRQGGGSGGSAPGGGSGGSSGHTPQAAVFNSGNAQPDNIYIVVGGETVAYIQGSVISGQVAQSLGAPG